jgi:hypothetical protein
MHMQVSYNPVRSSRFWLALAGVLSVILLSWFALNNFDRTLMKARAYVSSDQAISAKIGAVRDMTLYKLRYVDIQVDQESCFAEYYFYVSGANAGALNIKAQACGLREKPVFKLTER